MTKTRRSGGVPLYEASLRAQGQSVQPKTCRECGEPCTGRRRSWCSDRCVNGFRLRTDPGYQRQAVLARDHGVCSECGRDCLALARDLSPIRRVPLTSLKRLWEGRPDMPWWPPHLPTQDRVRAAIEIMKGLGIEADKRHGFPPHLHRVQWWDMDHLVPLDEGGTNDLANLQTLCPYPCHADKTREQARRRAKG